MGAGIVLVLIALLLADSPNLAGESGSARATLGGWIDIKPRKSPQP